MQPQKTHESDEGSKRRRKVQQGNLLLVGSEEGSKTLRITSSSDTVFASQVDRQRCWKVSFVWSRKQLMWFC